MKKVYCCIMCAETNPKKFGRYDHLCVKHEKQIDAESV